MIIWKFILSNLLSPLGTLLDRLGNWVGQHKEIVIFLFLGTSCLFMYTTFQQVRKKEETEEGLAKSQLQNDSLQRINAHLVYDRTQTYHYADSLAKKSYALKDSIKNVVRALPPAARTTLNRKLLTDLGFVR